MCYLNYLMKHHPYSENVSYEHDLNNKIEKNAHISMYTDLRESLFELKFKSHAGCILFLKSSMSNYFKTLLILF